MKTLEQNWIWLAMMIVPLLITTIAVSRNVLMAAVSISTNGLLVKKKCCLCMLDGSFLIDGAPARTEKNP